MVSIADFSKRNNKNKKPTSPSDDFTGIFANIQFSGSLDSTNGDDIHQNNLPKGIIDLENEARNGKLSHVMFREKETLALLETISRKKKPNPLLVGDAGVGKTQIVESLALRLYEKDPEVQKAIGAETKIYELRLSDLMAGSSYRGSLETSVQNIIAFASNPNVVLFVDEIHKLSNNIYSDIAQQLKPALSRSDLRLIGATTTQEVNQLMDDPAIVRRFSRLNIPELSIEQTKVIIENILPQYETYHGVKVTDKPQMIDKIIKLSETYKMISNHRPDTAITLMDNALAKAKLRHIKAGTDPKDMALTEADIQKSAIQDFQTKTLTKTTADELKDHLNAKIIGQDKAKATLVDIIKRQALKLKRQERPNTILLAGPSGVGKTQIAKELALQLFGSKDALIRIDMQEYSNPANLTRITGSSAGYVGSNSNSPLPLQPLNSNPFQIVLLDEIEKAHKDVQRFFMRAFDEGKVSLARKNEVIDTSKAIFIMTTNAGAADMDKSQIGFGAPSKPKFNATETSELLSQHFDREFLNRVQHKIICEPMTKDQYKQILAIKYNDIVKDANDNQNDRILQPASLDTHSDLAMLDELADATYNPLENGRPAERVMTAYVEDKILENDHLVTINLF